MGKNNAINKRLQLDNIINYHKVDYNNHILKNTISTLDWIHPNHLLITSLMGKILSWHKYCTSKCFDKPDLPLIKCPHKAKKEAHSRISKTLILVSKLHFFQILTYFPHSADDDRVDTKKTWPQQPLTVAF